MSEWLGGLCAMPSFRRKTTGGGETPARCQARSQASDIKRPGVKRPGVKSRDKTRKAAAEIGEIVRKRAEAEKAVAEARRSHARLREAIDILPQGIVFLDEDGRYILWNKKYAEIYNATADLYHPGVKLEDTLRIGVARGEYPEAAGREEEWLAERLNRLYHPSERHEQTLKDGRVILIEERLTGDGGVIGLRVDITELKQREASFRLLFDGNPVPMIVCALDDETILSVNDAAVSHYGYDRATFERMSVRSIQAFEKEAPWLKEQSEDETVAHVWKHVKADGSLIDVAIYSRQLVHDGRPAMLLALMDITERKQAEARLAFMAQHDSLTGLPNRAMLRQHLDDKLAYTRRSGQKIAVLCVDLDGFKAVNDALGHEVGDRLLKGVAKRLRSSLRDGDFLARLGADEFVVIHEGITRPEEAGQLGQASEPGHQRALPDRRAHGRGQRKRRHRHCAGRWRRRREAPEERGPRPVAAEGRRARHLQLLRSRRWMRKRRRAASWKSICARRSRTACCGRTISR